MTTTGDERKRQIAVGAGILLGIAVVVCGALIGWRYLPGLLGEWLGTMIGLMTTPFLLEASFAVLGLSLVIFINHWRQRRTGDELMYLEQVDDPDGLPEHASWAVFREPPLDGETPSLQAQAEGALAIGDFAAAAECLAAMSEQELKRPEILVLRRDLARATGRTELAAELECQIHAAVQK
jgi:hypothetical protein